MSPKKKILIIEDELILGELLLQKLNDEGYEAFWSVDGDAGLQKIREIKPDLVLLDILMPKKDGYQVLKEVRQDPDIKDTPVIVISNSGQPVEIKQILELGVRDYIIKADFTPAEVLEKIHKNIYKTDQPLAVGVADSLSGIKIMIVEDDTFLSSIIDTRLKMEGCTTLIAVDGEHALTLLEKELPDLILLDIVMPGISGFDVLESIKNNDHTKAIPVIMFSNLGQEHEVEKSRGLGAEDFFVKAMLTPREIVEKIKVVLRKHGK